MLTDLGMLLLLELALMPPADTSDALEMTDAFFIGYRSRL